MVTVEAGWDPNAIRVVRLVSDQMWKALLDVPQRNAGLTYFLSEQKDKSRSDNFSDVADVFGALERLSELIKPTLSNLQRHVFQQYGMLPSFLASADNQNLPAFEGPFPFTDESMFFLDARCVSFIEQFGAPGKIIAENIRKTCIEIWSDIKDGRASWDKLVEPWLPRSGAPGAASLRLPGRIQALALALWQSEVGPRLERERKKPPALVRTVHATAIDLFNSNHGFSASTGTLSFAGQALAKLAQPGASFDVNIVERGLSFLRSMTAHRVFRWEVLTSHDRAMAGAAYANILEVQGGWEGLCLLLGLNPKKEIEKVKSIIYTQAHFRFKFPDNSEGNMIQYSEKRAEGGRLGGRAMLTITVGAPLLPGFERGLKHAAEKRLVPMLRDPPPLYGRPNEHGEQMTLSLAVLAEMRERARELANNGSIQINHDDWTRLSARSGLPRKLIVPVREHWIVGDERSQPFLKTEGKDKYTLSDAHSAERAFLIEGGRRELDGAAAGSRSAAKRAAQIRRAGGAQAKG